MYQRWEQGRVGVDGRGNAYVHGGVGCRVSVETELGKAQEKRAPDGHEGGWDWRKHGEAGRRETLTQGISALSGTVCQMRTISIGRLWRSKKEVGRIFRVETRLK